MEEKSPSSPKITAIAVKSSAIIAPCDIMKQSGGAEPELNLSAKVGRWIASTLEGLFIFIEK
jgi:hypothetical protein